MKPTGLKAFWNTRTAYHLKIIVSSMIIAAIFQWILMRHLQRSSFVYMTAQLFIQLEIFLWLGHKFFPPGLKELKSTHQIIRSTILRLFVFYIVVLVIAGGIFLLTLLVNSAIFKETLSIQIENFMKYQWEGFVFAVAISFLAGMVLFLYLQWQDALNREQKLREEKLIFRYETLKSQVNPHFLFNSLNTLASLVETRPEEAGSYISRLASIYRYVLEKKELTWVPLADEIEFARNYFELQKIRDREKIKLEIDIPDPSGYKVLPISLQILFENVFKHNVASQEHPLSIHIKMTQDGYLMVTNPLQLKNSMEPYSGTGLHNLGERTRLMSGRDIQIIEKPEEFSVRIPLIPFDHESVDRRR